MNPKLPPPLSRRAFLGDTGMGFTGMALSAMLFRDGVAQGAGASAEAAGWSPPTGQPHLQPKAKSVIWIFNIGGVSHLESFDPKPMLNKYADQSIDETPFADIVDPKRVNENLLDPSKAKREVYKKIMPLQTGFRKYGRTGWYKPGAEF